MDQPEGLGNGAVERQNDCMGVDMCCHGSPRSVGTQCYWKMVLLEEFDSDVPVDAMGLAGQKAGA
jgi:hypothetical protein